MDWRRSISPSRLSTTTAISRTRRCNSAVSDGRFFEIEPHVQFYSNLLIQRSEFAIFYAGFCVVSAGKSRPSDALRCAPVDAFNQHCELRWRQGDAAFVPHHSRPYEPALIDPLVEQTEPVAVPEQDLDDARPLAPEGEQMLSAMAARAKRVPLDGVSFCRSFVHSTARLAPVLLSIFGHTQTRRASETMHSWRVGARGRQPRRCSRAVHTPAR